MRFMVKARDKNDPAKEKALRSEKIKNGKKKKNLAQISARCASPRKERAKERREKARATKEKMASRGERISHGGIMTQELQTKSIGPTMLTTSEAEACRPGNL